MQNFFVIIGFHFFLCIHFLVENSYTFYNMIFFHICFFSIFPPIVSFFPYEFVIFLSSFFFYFFGTLDHSPTDSLYIYIYVYIYIWGYSDRDGNKHSDSEDEKYDDQIYIYIYIYIKREREREKERERPIERFHSDHSIHIFLYIYQTVRKSSSLSICHSINDVTIYFKGYVKMLIFS